MFYFRLNALQRSRIAYGCIVALGSITAAGIAEIEIEGKVFSKWIASVSETIQAGMSPSSTQQQSNLVTSEHVFAPFISAGTEVSKVALKVWPYVEGSFQAIWMLKDQWQLVFKTIKDFLFSLFDSKIFNRIFENLHTKIWNVLTFAVAGGDGRDSFIALFGEDKKESTLLAAKLLLGQSVSGIKNFKVEPNVFHYLFLRWMDKPKEITNKFDRLSQYIKKLTDKLKGPSGSSGGVGDSAEAESPERTYLLKIPTVKEYLDIEEGWKESLFNVIWTGEVLMKIRTGTDDFVGAKTWATMFGGVLGKLGNDLIK
ncbi:hypothetical protein DNK47_00700 [Mycoplasma wenyonii]|uniref:Uncharacterized protein n=1 Tax=Mycoplasma wenyonii TaxID=65123 RepID=A0A328PLS9_9MOLU|nr:hypothetical protein [Mycoplasma wenyonii]RAO95354.1 hypothetical protein DNK47_00700 [Mycoplasma wenyonii]